MLSGDQVLRDVFVYGNLLMKEQLFVELLFIRFGARYLHQGKDYTNSQIAS
jgi:hypothetical protein